MNKKERKKLKDEKREKNYIVKQQREMVYDYYKNKIIENNSKLPIMKTPAPCELKHATEPVPTPLTHPDFKPFD